MENGFLEKRFHRPTRNTSERSADNNLTKMGPIRQLLDAIEIFRKKPFSM